MSRAGEIPKGYVRCCKVIGNGDFRQGRAVLEKLAVRLEHARGKHDWSEHMPLRGVLAVCGEAAELERAVRYETPERCEDEAFDVMTTAVRVVNGEWERG